MSQIISIANFKTGYDTYDQPEEMPNDAFVESFDMLFFRGVIEKRDGYINLVAPIPVEISAITNAANGQVTTATNHGFATGDQVLIQDVGGMTELNNTAIQPYNITVTGLNTFLLNISTAAFGVYTTGGTVKHVATICGLAIQNIANNITGSVTTVVNHNLTTGQTVFIQNAQGMTQVNSLIVFYIITVTGVNTFDLNVDTTAFGVHVAFTGSVLGPIQGLEERISTAFFSDLIAFTQSQAYIFTSATNEFTNISGATVWTGDDSRFFWSMNYQGSFWATNNFDPIRYYITGTTWTDYRPILFGNTFTQTFGPIAIGAVAAGPFVVANPPIIPGTVVIQLTGGSTAALNERFTDNGAGVLTGNNGSTGTVVYSTGTINITVLVPDPANARDAVITYDQEGDRLERALMIFPYKDRFIALDTSEGASFLEHPQRCRYSTNGTVYVTTPVPTGGVVDIQAWRQDVPGKGGFIDAPTQERIVTAEFVRDMLIVNFEFSSWRLRYTSNEAIPFTWERISSQLGAESTYSAVGFDEGFLSVGRTGVIISDPNQSKRIDEIIPDQVFQITNQNNAQRRVQGIRDFQRQVVYWTYPEGDNQHFPNRTLVFNYIDKNWTVYRQNFTTFGHFRRDDALTWGNAFNHWEDEDSTWGSGELSSGFPVVVAGNPFCQVFYLDRRITTDNEEPFNFSLVTKKFNPFIEQGMQCKAIYMNLLLSGTTLGEFTIEHLIDESESIPIATYTVSTNTNGQDKVWRRVQLSAGTAQYHQFRFTFSAAQFADANIPDKDVEIFKILLELAPGGRLNYGTL